MYRVQEIKDLLRKHDYLPIVHQVGDGVIVSLPYPKLAKPQSKRIIKAYGIKRGKQGGLFYNFSSELAERFISIPEYAIRLFLVADIASCCSHIPIDDKLICYMNEQSQEKERFEDIVSSPTSLKERKKETVLLDLFLEAKAFKFSTDLEAQAKTQGVLEGFSLIKSVFGS